MDSSSRRLRGCVGSPGKTARQARDDKIRKMNSWLAELQRLVEAGGRCTWYSPLFASDGAYIPHRTFPRRRKTKRVKRPIDQSKLLTTIAIWDLADDVEYEHVKKLFLDVNDVVSISFRSMKHVATVEFATEQSAEMAIFKLSGCHLMGRLLKFAWFEKDKYNIDRHRFPPVETLYTKMRNTVCVEGFDSSLNLENILCMLKAHFFSSMSMKMVFKCPTNPDGTSTGRVYIRVKSQDGLCTALERDGSEMGGHKLRVTRWVHLVDFPQLEEIEKRLAVHYRIDSERWSSSYNYEPRWPTPSAGMRTVFRDDSD